MTPAAEPPRMVPTMPELPNRVLLPEIGVFALVPDTWGGPWMPRHHILTRLGRFFHVVWFDPAREWRSWWLGAGPERRVIDDRVPSIAGFSLYRPGRWLPRVYRPALAARATERARQWRARRILEGRGAQRMILYLWRPEFEHALDQIPHELSCYHIDDEYSFAPIEQPLAEDEARLIRRVDQVIIHSQTLYEKKGSLNPNTALIPNGVDYELFAAPRAEPADLAEIPHPRIGYVGWVKEQLNLGLLADLTARHPTWSFVFVGPNRVPESHPDMRSLLARRNAYFLGARPVRNLAEYMQHMDVNIMPYVMNDYTRYIYPMKLHEYLAAGAPVVSSPIPAVEPFGHVVHLARTLDEWTEGLQLALSPEANALERREERRAVARAHDWNHLALRVARVLCERMGLHELDRLEEQEAKVIAGH
jgi:glycosyltransferase involved in cell wall biosynthesis